MLFTDTETQSYSKLILIKGTTILSRLNSIVFLATTLLITLQSQSSFAVTVNNPSGRPAIKIYEDPITQTAGLVYLQAWPFYDPRSILDFGKVVEIKPGGTDKLLSLLRYEWREPEWNFVQVGGLEGSFDITAYNPCTPVLGEFCGGRPDRAGGVGAYFRMNYNPVGDDPRGDNVHWIQRIIKNTRGFEIDKIDILYRSDPYYDTVGNARSDYFQDIPYTAPPPNAKAYFYGEVYLVEEVKNSITQHKTVNIYDGVRWGWEYKPSNTFKKFTDILSSGYEKDTFQLKELSPGAKYYAYINNDIPGNQCNPNTLLERYDDENGAWYYDNDNSHSGDGFASALTGIVPNNGTINLNVSAANPGRCGEDRGNYELNIMVFDDEDLSFSAGDSGGGGVSRERPGGTQHNPILPNARDGNWQVFRNVPGCRWYDPHTTYGFEFQALDDTLFTEILDFPIGDDNRFTVSVGDTILGEFSPGESLDFVSLFGHGISNFKITDIDSLFGST
ncbi:hypothetical protein QUB80_18615 [Chlorogloeopsis sp. ULAP01]|uniref:hypothetical protein n=1 Tax=Chlorogloeopsis sp. ULAP01 TaxID=3056483 RepID=UPI0025AB5B42|nr:hypothetical protein [Chlorogloeopsis sp. ULAP01]MDM9382709.1 hypothetical protein [Chlorogloeopsis sp. ULAP01]